MDGDLIDDAADGCVGSWDTVVGDAEGTGMRMRMRTDGVGGGHGPCVERWLVKQDWDVDHGSWICRNSCGLDIQAESSRIKKEKRTKKGL